MLDPINNLIQIKIQKIEKEILLNIDVPNTHKIRKNDLDSKHIIYLLANKIKSNYYENPLFDFLLNKFDINQKIYSHYTKTGKKNSNELITNNDLKIFFLLIYHFLLILFIRNEKITKQLRLLNVFSKIDVNDINPFHNNDDKLIIKKIKKNIFESLFKKNSKNKPIGQINLPFNHKQGKSEFQQIPITVLFYEGPTARSYLETLYSLKLKPTKIIKLIFTNNLKNNNFLNILPIFFKKKYSNFLQTNRIYFWPNYFYRIKNELCQDIFSELTKKLNFDRSIFDQTIKLSPLSKYCENVDEILIESLNDINLYKKITSDINYFFLFTGGGLLPKKYFVLPKKKIFHIHPGFLPEIRGADCFFWSLAIKGRPSASFFIMNEKIDEGDIINTNYLPSINLPKALLKLDIKSAYRVIYSFIDPWIRSYTLRHTLLKTNFLKEIKFTKQLKNEGTTYHFMEDSLKKLTLKYYNAKKE